MKLSTLLSHFGEDSQQDPYGAVIPPLYQNSLFTFKDWDDIEEGFANPVDRCIYSRGNNPTVQIVEKKIAALCGGEKAKLFGSGMGAISSAIMHYVKAGDHVLTINNIYGPTNNFLNNYLTSNMGLEVSFVEGDNLQEIKGALQDSTKLIYLESPSSVKFILQDIKAISQMAKERGIKTVIDNTWATPIFQKPLDMGIDLEVHSCSKYFGGHSDLVSGVIVGNTKDIEAIAANEYALFGAAASPFEAWLILRSMRTMKLRLNQHMQTSIKVAEFLEAHPLIKQVNYPGLPSFKQYDLGQKQMSGYTGLMSFEIDTDDLEKLKKFTNALKIFKLGVSWGGHESLAFVPAVAYLQEMPRERFEEMKITLAMVRISVGLEDAEDLIGDLSIALEQVQ
ncbi:MAG: trans-sulfuration enzyme family protein [Alphaproteobacteria bacterium]